MQKKHAEAEPLLREALKFREAKRPEEWSRFRAMALLGACLLEQGKHAEAEPLLLGGYDGMTAREARIPASEKSRVAEAGAWIVSLYDGWGKKDKADEWRAKLGAAAGPRPPVGR